MQMGYPRRKPSGAGSMKEQEDSVAWLKAETRPDLEHGRDVSNDPDFADRFRRSPLVVCDAWLNTEGLLAPDALEDPAK